MIWYCMFGTFLPPSQTQLLPNSPTIKFACNQQNCTWREWDVCLYVLTNECAQLLKGVGGSRSFLGLYFKELYPFISRLWKANSTMYELHCNCFWSSRQPREWNREELDQPREENLNNFGWLSHGIIIILLLLHRVTAGRSSRLNMRFRFCTCHTRVPIVPLLLLLFRT